MAAAASSSSSLLLPHFHPPNLFKTLTPLQILPKPSPSPFKIQTCIQYTRKLVLFPTPRIIVIPSGKDSVGKTTTPANLGISLARFCLSVVALDADVGFCNLDLFLSLESRINFTALDALNDLCRLDLAFVRPKHFPSFSLLCISKPRSKLPLNVDTKFLLWIVDSSPPSTMSSTLFSGLLFPFFFQLELEEGERWIWGRFGGQYWKFRRLYWYSILYDVEKDFKESIFCKRGIKKS